MQKDKEELSGCIRYHTLFVFLFFLKGIYFLFIVLAFPESKWEDDD